MSDEIIDTLNRTAKLFIDTGAAKTVEEALAQLSAFRMHITISKSAAASPTHQSALLTALNCGVRTMLGGVTVDGALDTPLAAPVAAGPTLADAVMELGGSVAACPSGVPTVAIGHSITPEPGQFAIRTTFDGWRGGIVPAASPGLAEVDEFSLSGALGGSLAVAEVFAHLNGDTMAGYRSIGLSLWDLDPGADWRDPASDGPAVCALPSDFFIIGLGHLGQAYLWVIGLLPYGDPGVVRLFLQDTDRAGESTQSTSVLTKARDKGRRKTRICSDWAERRGFATNLIERRFGADFKLGYGEPGLALCGVDNPDARRILDAAGFAMVLEAGLGAGAEDFRLIRLHSFPGPQASARIWPSADFTVQADTNAGGSAPLTARPAYKELREAGLLDECGLTRLANVAVGAPFVGMTAAAILIAQVLRAVAGGPRVTVANLDLRSLAHRSAVTKADTDVIGFATVSNHMHVPKASLHAESAES